MRRQKLPAILWRYRGMCNPTNTESVGAGTGRFGACGACLRGSGGPNLRLLKFRADERARALATLVHAAHACVEVALRIYDFSNFARIRGRGYWPLWCMLRMLAWKWRSEFTISQISRRSSGNAKASEPPSSLNSRRQQGLVDFDQTGSDVLAVKTRANVP